MEDDFKYGLARYLKRNVLFKRWQVKGDVAWSKRGIPIKTPCVQLRGPVHALLLTNTCKTQETHSNGSKAILETKFYHLHHVHHEQCQAQEQMFSEIKIKHIMV